MVVFARRARHAGRAAAARAAAAARCSPRAASRSTRSARPPRSRPRSPTTSSTTSRAPTRERLDDLRDRCAEAMMEALELPGLDHATAREVMLGALEFDALPRRPAGARALPARATGCSWSATGTARWPTGSGRRGCSSTWTRVVTSAEVGRGEARPRRSSSARSSSPARQPRRGGPRGRLARERRGRRARGGHPPGARGRATAAPPAGVEAMRSLAELPALL